MRAWLYGIATNLIGRHRRVEVRTLRALGRQGADLMAVLDSVPAGSALRNLWHFAPSLTVSPTVTARSSWPTGSGG